MARKRGAPVLIELMKTGVDSSAAADAPQLRLAPMEQIEAKPSGQTGQILVGGMAMPPRSGKGGPLLSTNWLAQLAKIPPVMWYVMTAVIVVSAVGYWFGFTNGKSTKAETDEQRRATELVAAGPQTAPILPQGNSGQIGQSGQSGLGAVPQVTALGLVGVDPVPGRTPGPLVISTVSTTAGNEPDAELQVGMNYLICGVFKRQDDADKSAAYLVSKGLPAVIIGAREFSGSASSKDLMVLIKRGYSREKYGSSGLREKVQGLGRLWRAEDKRAPTDFAQPYWDKFK